MAGDLKALQRDLRKLKQEVIKANNLCITKTGNATVEEAKRLSGGPWTTGMLRRAGHPYAKAWGSVQFGIDPSIINYQTGTFQRDWTFSKFVLYNGVMIGKVLNTAPYAKYLEDGTDKMFARPMKARLELFAERYWDRIATDIFATALSRTAFAR